MSHSGTRLRRSRIVGGVEAPTLEDSVHRMINTLRRITTRKTLHLIIALFDRALQGHQLIAHHAAILIGRHERSPIDSSNKQDRDREEPDSTLRTGHSQYSHQRSSRRGIGTDDRTRNTSDRPLLRTTTPVAIWIRQLSGRDANDNSRIEWLVEQHKITRLPIIVPSSQAVGLATGRVTPRLPCHRASPPNAQHKQSLQQPSHQNHRATNDEESQQLP